MRALQLKAFDSRPVHPMSLTSLSLSTARPPSLFLPSFSVPANLVCPTFPPLSRRSPAPRASRGCLSCPGSTRARSGRERGQTPRSSTCERCTRTWKRCSSTQRTRHRIPFFRPTSSSYLCFYIRGVPSRTILDCTSSSVIFVSGSGYNAFFWAPSRVFFATANGEISHLLPLGLANFRHRRRRRVSRPAAGGCRRKKRRGESPNATQGQKTVPS